MNKQDIMKSLAEKMRRENCSMITVAPETVRRDREIDIRPILESGLANGTQILDNGEIVRNI